MSLAGLPTLLKRHPGLGDLTLSSSAVVAVAESARAYVVAGLATISRRRPLVVVVATTAEAESLGHDLELYLGPDQVETFLAWETLPFERVSPSLETMGRRLRTAWRMRHGGDQAPAVVVASVRALMQRLSPHVGEMPPATVSKGDTVDPTDLLERLVAMGYRREEQVEHRGEVARRGSIVDVFGPTNHSPVRIDLWGDEVDRLSEFSVTDQRSSTELASVELFGCRELLPTDEVRRRAADLVGIEPWGREQWERLAEGAVFEGMESWLPWLVPDTATMGAFIGADALVLLIEPRRLRDRAAELIDEEASLATSLAQTWGAAAPADKPWPQLHLPLERVLSASGAPAWSVVSTPEGPDTAVVETNSWEPVRGDPEPLARQVAGLLADGFRVVVAAAGSASARRMAATLADHGAQLPLDDPPSMAPLASRVVVAPLEKGFIAPTLKLAVLVESDLTGRRRAHRRPRPGRSDAQGFFDDLNPGDHVVHHQHGVARFGGMVRRAIGGAERDYLLLEYRGGDKLYVPSDQIDAVRHYTGGETPTLHRLGGTEWTRTRARVRSAVSEVAQELVVLYRRRITSTGHAFAPDTPWQGELEEGFGWQETPDQLKAIADVKADMEAATPMDRLVCGDVGFGKTEVAIRAAFKAVQDGMQAAVLVPTTLLAQQHLSTFSDRFAGFPVRVEMLSRFLTTAQANAVVSGLEDGSVDVVVGTHRLLSADVKFKNLGLLVVDEEQRFGVSHKEAIKRMRADVDVLTLTATPIPRTLEMSLTGIRDLTILNTAPAERQPILTYVGEYDERAVSESIRRELLREGQVFFVHNRVADIEAVQARLHDMVPEARIAIAHGQMDEGALEKVVLDFWNGSYDVLLCTTIIESGIDMPTVNTLVVDRADMMGLGQLHQLRGRVGRAGQRAYAYLFYPPDRSLSEQAYERLKTIGEHTELGSGFKIAMRDLEIRGAGNLLGAVQSGHIAAVGYDLYVQMVSEAIAELKGEEPKEPAEVRIDIPVHANLPADYVSGGEQRLEAYRRLAAVTSQAEVDDVAEEWRDRYGPLPDPATALISVARLRAECVRIGVREVTVSRSVARVSPLVLRTSQEIRLRRLARSATYKPDTSQLVVPLRPDRDPVSAVTELLVALVPNDPAPVASESL